MASFAMNHLRFLSVDGRWMPALIFEGYVAAQTILQEAKFEGFEHLMDDMAKAFITRYHSSLSVSGNVAIVLGGEKQTLWEDEFPELKSFHLFLPTLIQDPAYCKNSTWNSALSDARKFLDIPQLHPASEKLPFKIATSHVLSPTKDPGENDRAASSCDSPTVNESVGDPLDGDPTHMNKLKTSVSPKRIASKPRKANGKKNQKGDGPSKKSILRAGIKHSIQTASRGKRSSPCAHNSKRVQFVKNLPQNIESVAPEREIAAMDSLPTTHEATRILLKLGYKTVNGKYFRPGCLPKDKKHLDEGNHYFGSISELRHFLCRRGVEGNINVALTNDLVEKLNMWVRCSISPVLRNETFIPSEARKPLGSIHNLLMKIGFKERGGIYYLPGAKPRIKHHLSLNGFKLDGPDGMVAHLCRHGLPESSDFTQITKSDRLRLELYLTECPDVNTFDFVSEEEINESFFNALLEVTTKPNASTETPITRDPSSAPADVTDRHASDSGGAFPDSSSVTIVTNCSDAISDGLLHDPEDPASANEINSSISPLQADVNIISEICKLPTSTAEGTFPTRNLFKWSPSETADLNRCIQHIDENHLSLSESSKSVKQSMKFSTAILVQGTVNETACNSVEPLPESQTKTSEQKVDAIIQGNATSACAGHISDNDFNCVSERGEYLAVNLIDVENAPETIEHKSSPPGVVAEMAFCHDAIRKSPPMKVLRSPVEGASPDQDTMNKEMEGFVPFPVNENGSPAPDDLVKTYDKSSFLNDATFSDFLLTQDLPIDSEIDKYSEENDHPVGPSESENHEKDDSETPPASEQILGSSTTVQVARSETEFERWIQSLSPLVKPDDSWDQVLGFMKLHGLTWKYNSGIISSVVYIFPGGRVPAKGGIAGHDFVYDMKELKMLAANHLAWKGDDELKSEIEGRDELGRRSRKRSRHASPSKDKNHPVNSVESEGRKPESHLLTASPLKSEIEDHSKLAHKATPEKKTTVGETLRSCQRVLQCSNVSKKLSNIDEGRSSKFKDQVETINKFLHGIISSRGTHGETSSSKPILYICGSPGVGKTSAIRWCCSQAEKSVQNGEFDAVDFIRICHIKTVSNRESSDFLSEIAENMGVGTKPMTTKTLKNVLRNPSNCRCLFLLVIDEVDNMISARNGTLERTASEKLLQDLLEIAADPCFNFSLIGVSNAVDNMVAKKLKRFGMDGRIIPFAPYDQVDLSNLVVSRIGSSIVDPKAMMYLASKVAAKSGDARMMLELVSSAVAIRYDSCTEFQLKEKRQGQYIVTFPDALKAVKATVVKYVDRIEALPEMAKLVLCVAVTICSASTMNYTMQQLRTLCSEVSRHEGFEVLDFDTFKQLVQQLVDQGLLLPNDDVDTDIGSRGAFALHDMPVRFGAQLQDVEAAVSDTLESKEVYRKLIDWVKADTMGDIV